MLSLKLGMTVSQLLSSLTARDLAEYEAYDALHPIDEIKRLELALGIVCATSLAPHRDKNKDAPTARDFMVEWGKETEEELREQMTMEDLEMKIKSVINGGNHK